MVYLYSKKYLMKNVLLICDVRAYLLSELCLVGRFSSRSPLKALRTPRTPGRPPLTSLQNNRGEDDGASPALRKRLPGSLREVCVLLSLNIDLAYS